MAKVSKKKRKILKAKKTTKKKTKAKKRPSSPKPRSETQIDKALIENFVTLQKIMVNFSAKFDLLSSQISKLLELFEISAKSLAAKDLETGKESKDTKKILEKLDTLSQQSGLIGRGLALIHEINSEKKVPHPTSPPPMSQRPLVQPNLQKRPLPTQSYQKSIASRTPISKPSSSMTKEIPK